MSYTPKYVHRAEAQRKYRAASGIATRTLEEGQIQLRSCADDLQHRTKVLRTHHTVGRACMHRFVPTAYESRGSHTTVVGDHACHDRSRTMRSMPPTEEVDRLRLRFFAGATLE